MRQSPFTAVYDACVLYPAPLRDFLMWLGLSGRFRARWSTQIHEEWKRNLLINRPDLRPDQVDRTSALMDQAIPSSSSGTSMPALSRTAGNASKCRDNGTLGRFMLHARK